MKLEDFDYYNEDITNAIYNAMNSTKFLGISGNVAFSAKGDRIAWTQIEQFISESIPHFLVLVETHLKLNPIIFNHESKSFK